MPRPLDDLVRALSRLPGLGRKSAERAALALVRKPDDLLDGLVAALQAARASVRVCDACGGFATVDANPCALCTDPTRDDSILCVVEEPGDILAMERAGVFRGRYHALLGKVSPARQTDPARCASNSSPRACAQAACARSSSPCPPTSKGTPPPR